MTAWPDEVVERVARYGQACAECCYPAWDDLAPSHQAQALLGALEALGPYPAEIAARVQSAADAATLAERERWVRGCQFQAEHFRRQEEAEEAADSGRASVYGIAAGTLEDAADQLRRGVNVRRAAPAQPATGEVVLVPREATSAMVEAGAYRHHEVQAMVSVQDTYDLFRRQWARAIQAVPTPQPDPTAARAEVERLRAVALGYEAWEGDLILNGDWRDQTPRMTQTQFDELMRLQGLRNAALAPAASVGRGDGA